MTIEHHLDVRLDRHSVVSRRGFLKSATAGAAAAGSLSWSDVVRLQAAEAGRRGMACILLWMDGGPSQFETLDPKPGHANGGETKAIATSVSGIQIAENFPNLAQAANDFAIVRSMTSKEGNHLRATYQMHTGYIPTATVKHPTLGSHIAHQLPNPACELPHFVRIGGRGRSAGDGGLLGVEYDPFLMSDPTRPPDNTQITTSTARYQRRLGLLGKVEQGFKRAGGAPQVSDHQTLYDKAAKMILSPQMKAFAIDDESRATRRAYGDGVFANGCLLARRLVESGVKCVEVTLSGWDTHDDNFNRVRNLTSQVDQPLAQLIADLKQRGLLDTTLVVWMGEFGRTPKINPRGGRDHYPKASSLLLAGAGVQGGRVIGATDASGTEVSDRPVGVPDFFRTVCTALKVDPDKENMSAIGRPLKVVDGGEVIGELLS